MVIAGGGKIPDEVRQTFVKLAGGKNARLVIIPAYHPSADQIETLTRVWRELGPASVTVIAATSREEAETAGFSSPLDNASGVWLSGGEQAVLSRYYVGTSIENKLRTVIEKGGVIGGNSAGAAAMTKLMVIQGRESAELGVGFDLLPDSVVDQHFLRRNRMQRFIGVLRDNPQLVGFGIDEGTALVVQLARGNLAVIGHSYVMAVVPAIEDGQPRYEIMKRGDQITLAGLRNGESQVHSPLDLEAVLAE